MAFLLLGAACGGTTESAEFHSLSVDDAAFSFRLGSVSISAEHANEFHRQYGNARETMSLGGFVATENPGHLLQRGDAAGGANSTSTASTGSTTLRWDHAPFSGTVVESDTTVIAAAPPGYEAITVLARESCFTLSTWDLWKLEPAPAQMLGTIEILEPTTATLVTTIVIESSICP